MRRTESSTDSSSTPSISHTLTLARPTKYPRVIRQNCRPQGVKYLNATSTARRQTAPIAQAMASHRRESMGAADQLIDGVNGFGPMVDVSLRSRPQTKSSGEGTRKFWIGCGYEYRRRLHTNTARRPAHRATAQSKRHRHRVHVVGRPPVFHLRRVP